MNPHAKETGLALLRASQYVFALLHLLLGAEPSAALLKTASHDDSLRTVLLLDRAEPGSAGRLYEVLKNAAPGGPQRLEAMKDEYTRLFLGPDHLSAPPWESVYTSPERLLFQKSILDVRRRYRKHGLLPVGYPRTADDHVSLLLHFPALLYERAADALEAEDIPLCRGLLTDAYQFETEHLLNWLSGYAADMEPLPAKIFYPRLVQALLPFLEGSRHLTGRLLAEEELKPAADAPAPSSFVSAAIRRLAGGRFHTRDNDLTAMEPSGADESSPSPDCPNAAFPDTASPGTPRWLPAACWHNCGGKCLVKVCVQDGVILRQKTDDISSDDAVNRQQRACLRGFSQRCQVHSPDRLKYPMKRRGWSPGAPHGELRGRDQWERITWEKAAGYIRDELTRIRSSCGDNAILVNGREPAVLLNKLDINYLTSWTTSSWGSWYAPGVLGWGDGSNDPAVNNDRLDLLNCDYFVAFGYNPAWSALGNATNYARAWKEAGCKFILFDPVYTDTSSILDAWWIPIRPGTDLAAMLAMAYVMLTEDEDGSLIDWDFLDRCCVGQDAAHMPDNARTDENFFDYLRGRYDGIPKTPEWAGKICGAAPDDLRRVARLLGRRNNCALLSGWASTRAYNTEQVPQMIICLAAMGGHIGKSGNCVGPTAWNHTNNFGPRLVRAGSDGDTGGRRGRGRAGYVGEPQLWQAVLGQPYNPTPVWPALNAVDFGWKSILAGCDLSRRVENVTADVHMIWNAGKAKLSDAEGAKLGIQAHRAVDFVLGQGHFLTVTNRYSDILLPISTPWEREGRYIWDGYMNRDLLLISRQVVPPFFETVSDEEACIRIGQEFGLTGADFHSLSEKERLFRELASSTVIRPDGAGWEPLCTVTQEDLDEWGVRGAPQKGRIPLRRFLQDGIYRVERFPGDAYGYIDKEDFCRDPEAHPIATATGRIEFYSQLWADLINSQGYSDDEYSPLPKYRPAAQGYESTFAGQNIGGPKGRYPLQCINPHYQRRAHTIFDNVPWLREACENPVFLASTDAREQGICDGDTVKISSPYGETLRRACVTARMTPGVVGLPHGAWARVDEATGIDRGGSDNYITGGVATGMGVSGYNTLNVQVEKYDGPPLPPDMDTAP